MTSPTPSTQPVSSKASRPREHRFGRLQGYLNATCSVDETGRSYLSRKEYRVPIHISKPYWNGSSLLLNVMSPTAGMLADDEVSLDIEVAENAALVLSNPSSLRIHKMNADDSARWTQTFEVGAGGFLEVNPEWLIPQGQSSFLQQTKIELQQDSELLFIEALAPGREAHGEAFAFRSFSNRFELYYDGKLTALEKQRIEPARNTHIGWYQPSLQNSFYLSVYLVSKNLNTESQIWNTIYEMQTPELRIGSSSLNSPNCWNIKLLSPDPSLARKTVESIRQLFYESTGRPCPKLRRQ